MRIPEDRSLGSLSMPVIMPKSMDIDIGNQFAGQFAEEFGGVVSDPYIDEYVQAVGNRVAVKQRDPDWPFEFHALNSNVINAFALPGGKVFITMGLLRSMGNEAQLAAVLGHECGHVSERHGMEQVQLDMLTNLGRDILTELAGDVISDEVWDTVGNSLINLYTAGYSRDQESEADQRGIAAAYKAGYNPLGAVQLMELFQSLEAEDPSIMEQLYATHPPSGERAEVMRSWIKTRYPIKPNAVIGEEQYRKAVFGEGASIARTLTNLPIWALVAVPIGLAALIFLLAPSKEK